MIVLPEECDIVDPIGNFDDALRAAVQVRGAISGAMGGFADAMAARALPVTPLPSKKLMRGDFAERLGDFNASVSGIQKWIKPNG